MLELVSLTRRYGARLALADVSFQVQPGSLFGFLGPNGAGKTTTMRIVNGIVSPDSGRVRWKGAGIDERVRLGFGYMPEERGLYPKMRLGEQIGYMGQLHGMSAAEARRATGHWMERLGLTGRERDRVDALSHGNQQRVQLACALVHDPALLILDEPFSGLDLTAVDELGAVLAERAHAGATVLFSSHQLELVERYCEEVAIIDSGRIVLQGNVDELRRQDVGNRLRLEVRGADSPETWLSHIPGLNVVGRDGDAFDVELVTAGDRSRVLDAARLAGDVIEFRVARPSLADLYRKAVRR